jgi:hypothetical protein
MPMEDGKVTRWDKGERTVTFLIDRGKATEALSGARTLLANGRLDSFA